MFTKTFKYELRGNTSIYLTADVYIPFQNDVRSRISSIRLPTQPLLKNDHRGVVPCFCVPSVGSSAHLLPGQTAGAVRRGQAAGVGRAIEKEEAGGA